MAALQMHRIIWGSIHKPYTLFNCHAHMWVIWHIKQLSKYTAF